MNIVESFIIVFCIVLITWMSILCYIKISKIHEWLLDNNEKNNKEDDNSAWILTYWNDNTDPAVATFDNKEQAINFKKYVKKSGYQFELCRKYNN